MNEGGIQRSAILLMSLGEEEAAEVFKFLGPQEVQKLGPAMARLGNVSREQVAAVLREFRREARQQSGIGAASEQYIRSVLTRALGSDKASALIERILESEDNRGIDALKWMQPSAVSELIKHEHPQIVATILAHLDPDQASEVLSRFPERLRNDVVLRIATIETVQPAALRDLNEVLAQLLAGGNQLGTSAGSGIDSAAAILNRLSGPTEVSVSAHLREVDPELARKVRDRMFVFDDLAELDDRAIQLLLREIRPDTLLLALKGASEQLREKVFRNMSPQTAETLRYELEAAGPVRLSQLETEQRELVRVVRRLAREGRIALGGKAEQAVVH